MLLVQCLHQLFDRFVQEFMWKKQLLITEWWQFSSLFHLFHGNKLWNCRNAFYWKALRDNSSPWLVSTYLIRGMSLNYSLLKSDLISPATSRPNHFYCCDKKGPGQVLQEAWPRNGKNSFQQRCVSWQELLHILTRVIQIEAYSKHRLFCKKSGAAFIGQLLWVSR